MFLRELKVMKGQLNEMQTNMNWMIRCVEGEIEMGLGFGLNGGPVLSNSHGLGQVNGRMWVSKGKAPWAKRLGSNH